MMTNEQIEELKELLLFHREQLAYSLQQKAEMGPNTAFLIRQVIHDNRAEVRKIKAALRAEGIEVADELADETLVASQSPPFRALVFRLITRLLGIAAILVLVLLISSAVVSMSKSPSFSYPFRIQSKQTNQQVANAQVIIEMSGSTPTVQFTDSEGLCSFQLDRSYLGSLAHIRVEATGFQTIVHEIELNEHQIPEILELEPLPAY